MKLSHLLTFGRFNPPTTGHEKLIIKTSHFLVKIGISWYSHLIPKTQRRIPFTFGRFNPHARKTRIHEKDVYPRFAKNIMTSKA